MFDSYGPIGDGSFWHESFPAVVLSGVTPPSGPTLYSWLEVLLDGRVGNWVSGQRFGISNARELNNDGVPSYPFYTRLSYEGNVSGQVSAYSFKMGTQGGAGGTDLDVPVQLTSTSGTGTWLSGGGLLSGLYTANSQTLVAGSWTNQSGCYFYPWNLEQPTYQGRYLGHQVAYESGTLKPVYGNAIVTARQATNSGAASVASGVFGTTASITAPGPGTYLFVAQVGATITGGASGAGDYLSARLWDETNSQQPGLTVTFGSVLCEGITERVAAPLTAAYTVTGAGPFTVDVQTDLVTTSPVGSGASTAANGNVVLTMTRCN